MQTNCYEVMNQSYFTVFIAAVFYLIVVISLLGFVRKYYKKPTRETDNLIHSSKTFIQYLSAFATLIGNPFLYGYNMAVLNNPAVIIAFSVMSEDDTSILKTVKQFRDSKTYNLKWSFIVAAYVFTGSIGVLIANNIAMKFGRKKPLMLNSLVVIIASCLLLGIKGAPTLLQQYLLLFYRAVIGISCGIGLVISGMYTMEVSRLTVNSVNGSYGTYNRWFQFYITLGIAVASFLGLDMVLGNKDWWLYLLGFNAIPATCNLLLFFGPDSPIFVYFKTKDVVKMGNELSKICTKDELPAKIDIVKKAAADFESIGPTQFSSIRNLLKDTTIRSKLVLVCILQAAQQLSGINVIFGYSSFIYQRSGVLFEIAEWTVFLTAFINCFSTFITLANKQDRKKLIVGSTICMGSAMFFLFFTNKFCHDYHVICPLLAITFVSMFVVAFSVGLGPIPYLEIQEKFEDQKTQGAVFTLSLAINWGCNFLVLIFFRILQLWMESYVYLLFTFMIFSISLYIGCCNREPLQSGNRESRDSEIGEMRPLKDSRQSTMSDFPETSSSNIDSTE